MSISIGADAITRALTVSNAAFELCLIEGTNPATSAGTIKKVYFYLQGATAYSLKVGTFYKTNGDTFSSRDYETISVTALGLNEKTVSLDVEVGDYIGVRLAQQPSGNGLALDYDAGWTNDYWRTLEETDFPYSSYTFDNLGKRIISIYGEFVGTATVTTQAVTAIVTTTATGNGNITDLGDADVTQHGHCWNTTGTPDTDDSKTTNGVATATGAFTSSLTTLTSGTKYYVRAYATNGAGTSYGEQVIFIAGTPSGGELSGLYAVVETRFHYVDAYGNERYVEGTII